MKALTKESETLLILKALAFDKIVYSIITFIPERKRIMESVQPVKIP